MSKSRRKFCVDQKLQIIQVAEQHGTTQTLRKHNLSHSVFLRWNNQFIRGGAGSLKPQYQKTDTDVKALKQENARLKNVIGNQALELELKRSFIKMQCPRAEMEGLAKDYMTKGTPVKRFLVSSRPGPGSFYYKKSGRPKGIRPSTDRVNSEGELF